MGGLEKSHLRLLKNMRSAASQPTQQLDFLAVPESLVNSTVSPASDRGWHPIGGGGLRFVLLPLTY